MRMNGIPKASMPSASMTRLPPTSARERNRRSGASGADERASIQANSASRAAESTSRASGRRPTDAGRFDDGVHERDERGRDRHGAGNRRPCSRSRLSFSSAG